MGVKDKIKAIEAEMARLSVLHAKEKALPLLDNHARVLRARGQEWDVFTAESKKKIDEGLNVPSLGLQRVVSHSSGLHLNLHFFSEEFILGFAELLHQEAGRIRRDVEAEEEGGDE